ncbi:Aste57867_17894 [Aphanomyces stellatus]|uniref:Aste57867_17894 protein n=1 Tax=Aphanomyces stellatus TaxID=120398 RepID=A0A485LAF5_9STRA|nr:hypothetical protein As57867_017833 [Aphanomyces stellatus]VFT94636.1 Aste57867_17894 [Aphanomyces stellatus]
MQFRFLALTALASVISAQQCSDNYSGTPGDAGWLEYINCGQQTSPSSNTNWPPANCNATQPPSSWPLAGPYSFPDNLDTGYGPPMTKDQIYAILSLVWVIENDGPVKNGIVPWWTAYSYIQNIGDKRGYTTNIVGFCTGTGDDIVFLQKLAAIDPCNPLAKYVPDVASLSAANSDKLTGLDGFAQEILTQGGGPTGSGPINPNYIQATWNTLSDPSNPAGYWGVAMDRSRKYNLALPITKGQLYDIGLNSGNVDLAINMVTTRPPTAAEAGGKQEKLWLADLQTQWAKLIQDPSNNLDGGQLDRANLWHHLLDPTWSVTNSKGQVGATNTVPLLQLELPVTVNAYGDSVLIKSPGGSTPSTPTPPKTTLPIPPPSSPTPPKTTPSTTIPPTTPSPPPTTSPKTTLPTPPPTSPTPPQTTPPTPQPPSGDCGNCANCYYAPTQACFIGWSKADCASIASFKWCGA